MKQRNWGRIVFISSESAINTPAEMIHYGMTKTAQLAVSRGLAQSCAGTAVTVNAVLPGPTHSAGVEEFAGQLSGGKPFAEFEQEFFKTVRPSSLLKRFAMPEEVGQSGDLRVQPGFRRNQRCRSPGGWRSCSSVFLMMTAALNRCERFRGSGPGRSVEPTSKTWSVACRLFCLRAQFGRTN